MFFAIVFEGNSRLGQSAKGRRYTIYGAWRAFCRDAKRVSRAVKLHQVKIRARKNCIHHTPGKNATEKKPGEAGLGRRFFLISSLSRLLDQSACLDHLLSCHFASFAI
jgi:hypothetical protein